MKQSILARLNYRNILIGGSSLIGLYALSFYNYLLFHALVELFSIVVASGIFIIAWNTRKISEDGYMQFLGMAYFFIACLDLLHVLGYKGMGIFPGYGANLATQLWIAARYMESLSFCIAPFLIGKKLHLPRILSVYSGISLLLLLTIFGRVFPACFIEGIGLTPFKKISEYLIIALWGLSCLLLRRRQSKFETKIAQLLTLSIVMGIVTEMAFTLYTDVYGLFNLLGHYGKLLSFYFMYKALIETSLTTPYDVLFRKVQQQNEFLNNILESLTHPFYVIDVDDYTIKMANSATLQNKPLETLRCYTLTHKRDTPCDGSEHPCPLEMIKKSKQATTVEHIHYNAVGEPRNVEVHAYPIFDKTGRVTQLIEYSLDITERKEAKQALKESEERYRELVDNARTAIIRVDSEGCIRFFNEYAEKLFEYRQEELLGAPVIGTIMPAVDSEGRDLPKMVQRFTTFSGSHYDKPNENENITKSGKRVWISWHNKPILDRQGRLHAIVSVGHDITTRKKAEQALEHSKRVAESANKAKSEFLANMSHEFRTPLNGILGYAQLLRRNRTLDEQQQRGLDIIQRSGKHLLTLVNDILDLSKVEAGKLELEPHNFQMKESLKNLVEMNRLQAQQKGLEFVYEPDPHLPDTVFGDETRLRQILFNLLGNAIKFTERGRVTLRVTNIEKEEQSSRVTLRFSVEDTGIGIAPEQLQQIFSPFEQLKDQRSYSEGTGLGLAISQRLTGMMGSELLVASTVGKGSLFYFDLDLAIESGQLESSQQLSETALIVGYTGNRQKILVVDDKKINRDLLKDMLTPLGFDVLEADNGREALLQAEKFQPNVILMDLIMPDMDGLEATQQILSDPALQGLPIIAVSANAFERNRQESLAAGCFDFLPKPIRTQRLFDTLQRCLNLEWQYVVERQEETSSPGAFPAENTGIPLPSDTLATLSQLAVIGDIMGIRDALRTFETPPHSRHPFMQQLSRFVKELNMLKIQELLEPYAGGDENHGNSDDSDCR